ncbi:hypothetical protein RZS08_60835, partial [Arthrospira platensis SPKY1]|nr:hypothetical protein [Arthrospira platensis SPKY1]
MKASVEISMYPLEREYVHEIKDFISRIRDHDTLECVSNGMSTQIFGEYRAIMNVLTDEIEKSFEKHGKSIFVFKLVNSYLKK